MDHTYRITKYNPKNRDKDGKYLIDEWTSFSDVGKTFDGSILTKQQYLKVEQAYVSSAIAFLCETEIDRIAIIYLENPHKYQESEIDIQLDKVYDLEEAERLFRLVLREKIWCKFGAQDKAYVHFGWDYYMYIGVPKHCPKAIAYAEESGLFVEPFESPYSETIE